MKKTFVILWLCILLTTIAVFFWRNELVYNLPTPVPQNYKTVAIGATISLPLQEKHNKPLFLHFFNPDCACSRFNIAHFKTLVKKYGSEVSFMIVPVSKKKFTEKDIQEKFGLAVPVLPDTSIAATCGVYSTPQAVIIDRGNHLYYRGNYNRSRYCTDKKTEYAKMALDSLLNSVSKTAFDPYALKAYGCQLPACTKN